MTDGRVDATVLSADGGTAYIGGFFNQVGPRTGGSAPINATSGLPAAVFSKVVGNVLASAPNGNCGWYIGGLFTFVGTLPRNNIAHILSAGASIPSGTRMRTIPS